MTWRVPMPISTRSVATWWLSVEPFISNPDLVAKLKSGQELVAPDFATFYTPGEKGYTDY